MTLDIYYNDLTPEAQKRYLEFFKLAAAHRRRMGAGVPRPDPTVSRVSAADGNLDIDVIPLFQLEESEVDWE